MSNHSAKKLHEEGVTLFRKGKLEAALQKLDEALQNATEDSQQSAQIYNDQGVVYQKLEDYPAAHKALDEAERIFTTLDDKKGQAQALGNRAALYEAEGSLNEAVELYKESAAMLEAVGENDMAMYVWQAVSRLRTKQGQYIAAIGAYEEGVSKMPKSSFKRKVLERLLKAPTSLLGGVGSSDEAEEDE